MGPRRPAIRVIRVKLESSSALIRPCDGCPAVGTGPAPVAARRNARGTRSGAGWPSRPPSGSGTNCRPYRQRSVHQSARADERRARTNVSPDERGGGNAASSEVARRIRAPAVITLVELATGLAVCSPGGRSASSPEARPRVGRRLVVGQDPPIALRAGAARPTARSAYPRRTCTASPPRALPIAIGPGPSLRPGPRSQDASSRRPTTRRRRRPGLADALSGRGATRTTAGTAPPTPAVGTPPAWTRRPFSGRARRRQATGVFR